MTVTSVDSRIFDCSEPMCWQRRPFIEKTLAERFWIASNRLSIGLVVLLDGTLAYPYKLKGKGRLYQPTSLTKRHSSVVVKRCVEQACSRTPSQFGVVVFIEKMRVFLGMDSGVLIHVLAIPKSGARRVSERVWRMNHHDSSQKEKEMQNFRAETDVNRTFCARYLWHIESSQSCEITISCVFDTT